MLDVRRVDAGNKRSISSARGQSAIFPLIVGDEQAAMDLANSVQSEGFLVPAIRYPTVAKSAARLRITVTAAQEENQIRELSQAIRRLMH
jgi:8-amino-7-oxononanoate synthase